MTERKDYSGQTVRVKNVTERGTQEYRVEGYWDELTGRSWAVSDGNPAAIAYAVRTGIKDLPLDDNVLYGKIGPFGHLVHVDEIQS